MNKTIRTLLICLFISSCSTTKLVYPSKEIIDRQEESLRKLYIGQSFQDVSRIIELHNNNHFEVLETADHHLYFNYNNYETKLLVGVYFVNGKLASILSQENSVTLFACRTMFKTTGRHWLSKGMKPYSDWITSRNALNNNFNYRENHPSRAPKSKLEKTAGDIAMFVGYSPVLIASSPFVLFSWNSGDMAEDKKKAKQVNSKIELASSIPLGTDYDSVIRALGKPSKESKINNTLIIYYDDLRYTFGVNESNVVIWKEPISMLELFERQQRFGGKVYGKYNCGELDSLWN